MNINKKKNMKNKVNYAILLVVGLMIFACRENNVRVHTLRLEPGMDLNQSLAAVVQEHGWQAASISTCVGSLTDFVIRPANQRELIELQGHFEIVSLTGTFSEAGTANHLHIAVSDSMGQTIGGHLMDGNMIYTTAEVVLLIHEQEVFTRPIDPRTTWDELVVTSK